MLPADSSRMNEACSEEPGWWRQATTTLLYCSALVVASYAGLWLVGRGLWLVDHHKQAAILV